MDVIHLMQETLNCIMNKFYTMNTVNDDVDEKVVSGRVQGFPRFAAKQYEFFHYMEMCECIGKDVCMLKARAVKTCRPN